jgi:hypothetical protein
MGTVRRPRWSNQAMIATFVLIGLIWILALMVSLTRPQASWRASTPAVRRNSGVTNRSGYGGGGGWALPAEYRRRVAVPSDATEPLAGRRGLTRS